MKIHDSNSKEMETKKRKNAVSMRVVNPCTVKQYAFICSRCQVNDPMDQCSICKELICLKCFYKTSSYCIECSFKSDQVNVQQLREKHIETLNNSCCIIS